MTSRKHAGAADAPEMQRAYTELAAYCRDALLTGSLALAAGAGGYAGARHRGRSSFQPDYSAGNHA
jgi:hypothetical protein